jgi:tRNA threonylcarbamoyladenosine biosynthesis protein TsaE
VNNITIFSTNELTEVVSFIRNLAPQQRKFLLVAEMGSGKTTFVAAFCKQLGVKEDISSPTFSLVNEYAYEGGLVRHIDLYRLKKVEEALDFGIEDFFYDDDYLFIEWPEIVANILPEGFVLIRIIVKEDNARTFTFEQI